MNRDELGPGAAKAYPGPNWSDAAQRPHCRPDDTRSGSRWAVGALAHRTGAVVVAPAATRDTAAWLHCLDGLETFVPAGDVSLIVDALPLHGSRDTRRWNGGHPRLHFVPVPKRAAWLNLSAGCWKSLRQRARARRVCTSTEEVDHALHAGGAAWNQQPTPFLWGRPPKPRRHLKRKYVYRI